VFGAEVLADFAPNFKLNNVGLASNPDVNGYMLNAILGAPMGGDSQFKPYISGGVGEIQLRSDVLNTPANPASGFVSANQAHFGGDIGAGLLAYSGNVGVRADVRYFRHFTTDSLASTATTPADNFAQALVSSLDFWRANIGIALRW
jgi:hypothetical protein